MRRVLVATLLLIPACPIPGTSQAINRPSSPSPVATTGFDTAATSALAAMRARADELHITGVAVVATFAGDTITSWTSRMAVVGRYKDDPKDADKGSNLIAIAYAKAAEMADTHLDSGSNVRPPMTGEFGWSGGVIARGRTGYLVVAFSGGKSEDDVKVSQAGLTILKSAL